MTDQTRTAEPVKVTSANGLKRNAIGVWGVVFAVVAMAAPLTAMSANTPIQIGFGNGAGAAGAFLIAGIVLAVFGIGYAAMSRFVVNSGAFYAYVSEGLGRRLGLGTGFLAVLCYNFQVAFVFVLFGVFARNVIVQELGVDLPWWLVGGIGFLLAIGLSLRGVAVSARALGVALVLEVTLLMVLAIAVLINNGPQAYTPVTFTPAAIFSGVPGVALAFAFLSFIGFEATAILSEETKDPRRSVAKATYIAVTVISVIYIVSTWSLIASYGPDDIREIAAADPGNLLINAMREELGPWAGHFTNWLLLVSLFAVFLAIHNMATRYLYAFGRAGLLPTALSRTHSRYKTPWVAAIAQAVFVIVVIVVSTLTGADPYLDMVPVLGGITALGIILLQAAVSLAVIGFFWKRTDGNVWVTKIAPAVAAVALTTVGILVITNFDLITGKSDPVIASLPWLLLIVVVVGFVVASVAPRYGRALDQATIEDPVAESKAAK